jgi:geranylgeranyl pyrophosphate synthase
VSATAPRDEPAPAQLAHVLEAGGAALRTLLDRTERRLADVAAGHGETLGRHATATLAAGGKRLRPMLVFLAGGCADTSGAAELDGAGGEALVRAGAAVELLHMATLVHDDVLDRAALRRGRPTVYESAGRAAATATGDLLFSRAFAELVRTGDASAVRALSDAASALARGELIQREDAFVADVTPERYLERCELKTARLFEAACRLGALLGAPGPRAAEPLGAFGLRVGVAFQVLDDVLDVSGPPERTGKPRGADLLDGTVTLPLILARDRDPELASLDPRTLASGPAGIDTICDHIELTSALSEARDLALRHIARAKEGLGAMELPPASHRALGLVADGVVDRYA